MPHAPRASRRWIGLPLLLLLLLPTPARAEETVEEKLFEARHLLRVRNEPEAAVELFDDVLRQEGLDARTRGEALWGAGECHAALGRWDKAFAAWDTIVVEERTGMPADVVARARQALDKHAEHRPTGTGPGPGAAEPSSEQELAARKERLRQQVEQALDRAREAFDVRKFDDARREVTWALAQDPENAEALHLRELIEREQPDRGEMIRTLLRFYETVRSESFQRLKTRARQLEEQGQRRRSEADLEGADLAFREAIALIDRSEFGDQLEAERWNLVFWLRQVATDARAKGIALAPEPTRPPGPAVESGVRGRFYALLSETFGERVDGGDPIRFHEFAPLPTSDTAPQRALGPNAFASARVGVEQSASSLTRARFAERYVRATLATDWPARQPSGARPSGAPRKPVSSGPPRILELLDDVLLVQHTEAVQREVDALRQSFAPRPPPVQIDVSVYGAGSGGTVRIASALRLPGPGTRESGLDGVAVGQLIEECRTDLATLQNVTLLGNAQLRLTGDVGARLEITERTEAHPLHATLPEPPLTLLGLDAARYGLWLDIYGEDLSGARKPPRAGALSVVARSRLALPSVVVRKAGPAGDWSRLPKFSETTVEADRRVPHAATLVLFGLPNPFVDSAALYPDLVLLIGLRPAGPEGRQAPLPDPPPFQVQPREDAQEHPVGPLAVEVQDDLVLDGWPVDRSASAPPPEGVAREARDQWLGALLASRARLLTASQPNPVRVHDGLAELVAGPQEHLRLEAAIAWLAAQERALYDVETRVYDVPREAGDAVFARVGVAALPSGEAWTMPAAMLEPVDAELARASLAGPFALRARQAARATQQVVARQLVSRGITRQVRVLRGAPGTPDRLVPVPGLAEEGVVVQVRPGVDEDGRRVATVRARAAQLRAIEPVPMTGVEPRAAYVDVPRWHGLRDHAAAAALADGEPLWIRLEHPSDPTRSLLVRVVTRRLA